MDSLTVLHRAQALQDADMIATHIDVAQPGQMQERVFEVKQLQRPRLRLNLPSYGSARVA